MWIVLVVAAFLALVVFLVSSYPETLEDGDNKMAFYHNLAWLVLLGGAVVVRWRTRPGAALRDAALWIAIGAVIFLGYSFRHDATSLGRRMLAELMPHKGQADADTITFTARAGGHFVAEAQVDGTDIRFLVDTGASDVVLSPRDARKLGFDLSRLSYDRIYRTANGTVKGAPVRLGRVRIGPIEFKDVRASVNGAPMSTSLLGMSFLSRLKSYEVTGDKLTLRR